MKRILMTGGGTAGHVTPNLALMPKLRERGFDIHYIGQASGIERKLIEPTGIPFHSIQAGKMRRYIDMQNITDIFRIGQGFLQTLTRIRQLRPDVLFSKGGFVSCPVVWAAWVSRVPVVIHESDITPGLANKLSLPFAKHICYSFPETKGILPAEKALYTGIPIREELQQGNPAEGRKLCGFTDEKPVVLVIGGSQGALSINQAVHSALDNLLNLYNVCHLCGQGWLDESLQAIPGYQQFDYVNEELPDLLAMADVVLSRAGATTLFELLALCKANLLIPLPLSASRGDQILNAQSFKKRGFSHVLRDEALDGHSLIEQLNVTFENRQRLLEAMQAESTANSLEKVLAVIENCVN